MISDPWYKTYDVITIARLVPWKGIEPLIDLAARNLWSLLIVGDGPLMEALRTRIRSLNTADHIKLARHVHPAKAFELTRQAKVFVLNSSYEGLPHVVLEAMAAGTAVIATDVGGTGELVKNRETSLLINSGDSTGLENAITSLLADPSEEMRLVEGARKALDDRFSFKHMVEETINILKENPA